MAPTYSEYLRLKELLKLQAGVKGQKRKISNDELHFIIVHQNFELWFKLVISELKCTRDILSSDYVEETKLPQAVHHMNRVIETFKLMSLQWKVMETLEPKIF
jgi:tryptophan 2,3-dioxygenase